MIEGLKPYREYKESGLQWLGKIPREWNIVRAKSIFECIDKRSESGKEELLTVSSDKGIVPRRNAIVTMFKAKSYRGYKLCWPEDLVINSLWAWGGGLGVSRYHGIISTAYGVYRVRKGAPVDPWYVHEVVRSAPFNWELRVRSKGIWISRLQLTDIAFLDAPFPLPPPDEQAAIVRFLDHANGKVERAIRAKRKLIALLNEQKEAIIHRAVTRGLDPSVKLKPSGIPWLGDAPAHWEVTALRRHWRVTDCKHLTVPFVEEGIPLASVVEVQSFTLNLSRCKKTTHRWYGVLIEGDRKPKRGDLIYCRNTSVGACALVETDIDFAMGQDVCLIRSERQNQKYMNYLLHGPYMGHQLELILVGSTFKRINVAEIKALTVLVPPKDEQDAICEFLDTDLAIYDTAFTRTEREIALLREYRTTLTADVVTGKLDIREAVKHLPAAAEELPPADDLSDDIEDDAPEEPDA
jgi:type I restriction enzyme, S subunit